MFFSICTFHFWIQSSKDGCEYSSYSRLAGGPLAGQIGGGFTSRPRCSRIFLTTFGSSIAPMMRTLPPQALHVSTSMLKTRLSSRAQVMRVLEAGSGVSGSCGIGSGFCLGTMSLRCL